MSEMRNQRMSSRTKCRAEIQYNLSGSTESRAATLVDYGAGGFCMETCSPVKTGTKIIVHLSLPPEQSESTIVQTFQAIVRWNRDLGSREQARYGIGVQYSQPAC